MMQQEFMPMQQHATTITASPSAKQLRLSETPLKAAATAATVTKVAAHQHLTTETTTTTTVTATANFDSLEEVATRLFMHRSKDLTRTDALMQTERQATEQCGLLSAMATRLHALRSCHEATVEGQSYSLAHRKQRLGEVEGLVAQVAESQLQLNQMGTMSMELYKVVKGFVDSTAQSDTVLNAATRVMRYSARRRDMGAIVERLKARVALLEGADAALKGYIPTRNTTSNSGATAGTDGGGDASSSTSHPLIVAILPADTVSAIGSWSGATAANLPPPSSSLSPLGASHDAGDNSAAAVTMAMGPLNYPAFIDASAKAAEGTAVKRIMLSAAANDNAQHRSGGGKAAEEESIDAMVADLKAKVAAAAAANTTADSSSSPSAAEDTPSSSPNSIASYTAAFDALLEEVTKAAEGMAKVGMLTPSSNDSSSSFSSSPHTPPSSPLLTAQKTLIAVNKAKLEALYALLQAQSEAARSLAAYEEGLRALTADGLGAVEGEVGRAASSLAAAKEGHAGFGASLAALRAELAAEEQQLMDATAARAAHEETIAALTGAESDASAASDRIAADTSEASIGAMLAAEGDAVKGLTAKHTALRDDVAFLKATLGDLVAVYGQTLVVSEAAMDADVLQQLVRRVATVTTQASTDLAAIVGERGGEDAAADAEGRGGSAAAGASTCIPNAIVEMCASQLVDDEDDNGEEGDRDDKTKAAAAEDDTDNAVLQPSTTATATAAIVAESKKKQQAVVASLSVADLTALTGINVTMLSDTTHLHVDGLSAATITQKGVIAASRAAVLGECDAAKRRFATMFPNYAPTVEGDVGAIVTVA